MLILIAFLLVLAAPVLAQTSASPSTVAVASDSNAPLPDAPNPAPRKTTSYSSWTVRPMATGEKIIDKEFVAANGLMFGSSIATVELTHRCLENGACSLVPRALVRRRAMYGVGLPAEAGITVLGYYLKRGGHNWWLVPAALVTAGNTVYAVHAAQHMR